MQKKVDRQTTINMLNGLIETASTVTQLDSCSVIVHDIMWTRYSEDQEEKKMQSAIKVKRANLLNKKGC